MVRIIDMECSIPRTEASQPEPGHDQEPTAAQPAGYGMANYSRIFSSRREGADHRPEMSLDAYVDKLGKLGIVRSVPFGITNEEETTLLRRYPDRFIGLARISIHAFKGMTGVRELERLVREEGFKALGVSALVDMIPASDRRYYPLYTKAAELGIPVRIYSSMNYANDRPYDLGHPRHLDQVAMDFPELRIIGGLALGQRDGRARAAAPESAHGHLGAPGEVSRPARIGLGDADAVRQHLDPGQGARRALGGARRPALRNSDRRVHEPAAEGHCEGEMALRQRRARLRARVTRPS